MTWVIGTSSIWGYGVIISDVQVQFSSGDYRDMLQKAYPLARNIAGGFAGSVRIGFHLLQELANFLEVHPSQYETHAWDPVWVAQNWPKIARGVFASHSWAERKLQSHIVMVGVSPNENRGAPEFPTVYVVRFASPNFEPRIFKRPLLNISIGSGSGYFRYKQAVKQLSRVQSGMQKAEIGHKFGWADQLCFHLCRVATEHPKEGVSRHFNVLAFDGHTKLERNSDHRTHGPDGTIPFDTTMPPVAKSFSEFQAMAVANGTDSACAVA